MGDKTGIEWTDHTFNPWWGCAAISPGCTNCYAEALAKRYGWKVWGVDAPRRMFDHKHWAEPLRWNRLAGERGVRERVFCASMADVFENHPGVEGQRAELWTLIHKTPNLDWQLLTKRVGNVARMVPPSWLSGHWPAHAWLGISVVNQEEADRDVPKLLELPARIRFLSCEPLLGPIDLTSSAAKQVRKEALAAGVTLPTIDWVISGGESGPKARPSHPDWHRSLRDQCAAAGVPFLFKQWGEHLPGEISKGDVSLRWQDGSVEFYGDHQDIKYANNWLSNEDGKLTVSYRVGKKAAGRELDGRTHDGFPAPSTVGER